MPSAATHAGCSVAFERRLVRVRGSVALFDAHVLDRCMCFVVFCSDAHVICVQSVLCPACVANVLISEQRGGGSEGG